MDSLNEVQQLTRVFVVSSGHIVATDVDLAPGLGIGHQVVALLPTHQLHLDVKQRGAGPAGSTVMHTEK